MQEELAVLEAASELHVGINLLFNIENIAPKMEKPLLEICVEVIVCCFLPLYCDC